MIVLKRIARFCAGQTNYRFQTQHTLSISRKCDRNELVLHWIQSGQQCSRQLWTQTKTLLYKQQLKCAQTGAQVGRPYQRLQIGLSVLLFFLLSSAILVAWPLLAAIELNYFDIFVAPDMITLEWSTANEYNTAGFEVYCKEEEQPDSKFHLIDQRIAQGSGGQGAIYRLDLTRDLVPSQTYCFRLREITTDNTIGEVLQLCGYGLNITPTPQATATLFGTPNVTATVTSTTLTNTNFAPVTDVFTNAVTVDDGSGNFNQISPFDLTATSVALFGPPIPTATPAGGFSPLETPTPFIPAQLPTIPLTNTPISALPSTTFTQTQDLALQQNFSANDNLGMNNLPPDIAAATAAATTGGDINNTANNGLPQSDQAIANPPYIVQTATPQLAAAPLLPTFTPYPTAVAIAEGQLMAATLPNTQNLMMLLLCGVFSGASGLGILGLITTLLYMRSRAAENKSQR